LSFVFFFVFVTLIAHCLEKTKLRCLVSSISLGLPATSKSNLDRLLANAGIHVQGMLITNDLTTSNLPDHTVGINEKESNSSHLSSGIYLQNSQFLHQTVTLLSRKTRSQRFTGKSLSSLLIANEGASFSSRQQDITMRVLDSCNTIVASSLEQTTWLRKNLQVRVAQPDTQSVKSGSTSNPLAPVGTNSSNETSHLPTDDASDFDGKLR
jgi:hypothetical protein